MPHWGIVSDRAGGCGPGRRRGPARRSPRRDAGGRRAALRLDARCTTGGAADAESTELPARMLRRYLDALRRRRSPGPGWRSPAQIRTTELGVGPTGDVGMRLALVAGLNAARPRCTVRSCATAYRPSQWRPSDEPTAAESARLAGVRRGRTGGGRRRAARDRRRRGRRGMNGWQIGLPEDPVERDEYRTRGLVGLLLIALEQETRDPEPPGRAGQLRRAARARTSAVPFHAEITFTMGLAAGRDPLPGRTISAGWRPRSRSGRAASGPGSMCTPTGPARSSGRSTPTARRST